MAINFYGEPGNVSETFKQYQREINKQREEQLANLKHLTAQPLFDDEDTQSFI